MARQNVTKRAAVREAYTRLGSLAAAAREAGCNRGWAREVCSDLIAARTAETPDAPTPTSEFRERADGTADLALVTDRPIKTLDDLIRVAEIDLTVWWVESWEASAWTTVVKERSGKTARPVRTQQHRVKARLKRVQPRALADATEAIFARMAKHAPDYRTCSPQHKKCRGEQVGEPTLAVFGLFDAHFGKLAWAPETGNNYDLRIAEAVYANAVHDLLAEVAHRNVDRFLLPIGNDHYHINDAHNRTFAGTAMDVDGRYGKIIETGEMSVIRAVESMASVAPVDVVWVAGNHDITSSLHLARTVKAWFRNHPGVTVDTGPSSRKYYQYGVTLIGLSHGNDEKHIDLPDVMANERPAEWAVSTCREWLLGHLHHSRRYSSQDTDQRRGTTVRVLRSLSGTDAWHARRAYINTGRAAEVYLYTKTKGYAGHSIALVRE